MWSLATPKGCVVYLHVKNSDNQLHRKKKYLRKNYPVIDTQEKKER